MELFGYFPDATVQNPAATTERWGDGGVLPCGGEGLHPSLSGKRRTDQRLDSPAELRSVRFDCYKTWRPYRVIHVRGGCVFFSLVGLFVYISHPCCSFCGSKLYVYMLCIMSWVVFFFLWFLQASGCSPNWHYHIIYCGMNFISNGISIQNNSRGR